jgi:hypothetical protein
MIANDLNRSILSIIDSLMKCGLCINQNEPYIRKCGTDRYEITCCSLIPPKPNGTTDYYDEMYTYCASNKIFSIMLIDGGLIQLRYICDKSRILWHRLAYLPCRDAYRYDDCYDEYIESQIYLDIVSSKVSVVPVRMDFDPPSYVEDSHPQSHVHLGFHKDCRIPVNRPVEPSIFCTFIIQHFYHSATLGDNSPLPAFSALGVKADETMSIKEKERLFINI